MPAAVQQAPFVVVITDAGAGGEVADRIRQLPDAHELASNIWLVRSPLLVRDLTDQLGMGDPPLGAGIVFRLNGTYWGRADPNTWDWLSRGE